MKKFIPTSLVLFLIGGTALWYFGHHRPTQKLLTAEPQKVYKVTTPQPSDTAAVKQQSIEKHAHEHPDGTEVSTVMNQENDAINPNAKEFLPTGTTPSTPNNGANDGTENEHSQTLSREEIEDKNAEFKALMAEIRLEREARAAGRERTQEIKDRKVPGFVRQLESKSPEEQRAFFLGFKNYVYSDFLNTSAGAQVHRVNEALDNVEPTELLDIAWNSLLDMLADYGYTPPKGIE